MIYVSKALKLGSLCLMLLAGTSFLHAQPARTWVSGVGDDANPCSRTAPCKTFAGAFMKTAAGGEIDALDSGGFGTVTINKAITIDGAGYITSILPVGSGAITVNAGATDTVILRNVAINGSMAGSFPGIRFISGAALHIEHCVIFNFKNSGIDFEPTAAGSQLIVENTTVRNNGAVAGFGNILVKPASAVAASASLSNVRLERGGFGLRIEDGSKVTVRESIASGAVNNGFIVFTQTTAAELNIDQSTSTNNQASGIVSNGANSTVRLNSVTVTNNAMHGLFGPNAGKILSFSQGTAAPGTNNVAGNGPDDGSPTGYVQQK